MASLSGGKMTYTPIEDGLRKCVREFINDGNKAVPFSAIEEAYMDKVSHTPARLSGIPGWKKKVKYLMARYTPYLTYKRISNR